MTEEEETALLAELEADLQVFVQEQLDQVSDEFLEQVDAADELVAAAFSVSRIAGMWRARVPGIMERLRTIARRSSIATAEQLDEPVPSPEELDQVLDPYEEETRPLVEEVGNHLSEAATTSLAEGVANGESLDELKARMRTVFSDTGSQLGPVRSERIAQTEANRAWNAGVQAAAEALSGPARPLVKQWRTMDDDRVRRDHRDANGQLRLLDEAFDVGGFSMRYPGDPTAPASLVINCRCRMRATAAANREGGAPVEGDNLSAAAQVHTGAMIALIPSETDAARMALEGGEAADQLHVTLFFLGEAADWDENVREELKDLVRRNAPTEPVYGKAFGAAQWNPNSDDPAWVWSIGDNADDATPTSPTLESARRSVISAMEDTHNQPDIPTQHTPWVAHMTGVYDSDTWPMATMQERTGPVLFDRIRVAFAGENYDIPLIPAEEPEPMDPEDLPVEEYGAPNLIQWSTPGNTALAFENQQTGDGRVFSAGALYWPEGPLPLQYVCEMRNGHEGARLAGAIETVSRDGGRIAASGVIYPSTGAGYEAGCLLALGAPLGVSVDLDDVDIELVDVSSETSQSYRARMATASLLPLENGGWHLMGETEPELAASGSNTVVRTERLAFTVGPDGLVPSSVFELVAAAGDPDVDGTVVEKQSSGDYLMRITRGRMRGATLVAIPAYADAKIVLENAEVFAASLPLGELSAASTTDMERVIRSVRKAKGPIGAAKLSKMLKINVQAVHRLLATASQMGEIVRITRGLYTDHTTSARGNRTFAMWKGAELVASVTGSVDLPVAERDHVWDGDAATTRVFDWADGDAEKIARAYAYRDDSADPLTKAAYKLGYADVEDGSLVIIPKGVSAARGAVNGARGGVDLPEDQVAGVRARLEEVQAHVDEELGGDSMKSMEASAWAAMADLPPMPAAWFKEPTTAELPPGGPGVNYANGRVFGWVAQANEPHAGYAKKIVINDLGRIDTTHFLRQRFTLDDGSSVKAGAFTMNVGHHRDGAECETSSCQFDDTRTVAGIVTVGQNERGIWFSGAAAPWLAEWDRTVFMGTQPSYHMKRGQDGRWQLRAVLAVPVPGHSSPLLASAVVERSQMALTAAATMAEVDQAVADAQEMLTGSSSNEAGSFTIDYDRLADCMVAALARSNQRKEEEEAELAALLAEAAVIDDPKES